MKVTISNSISLDGFICGPDGYEDWISEADEKYFLLECEAADVIILGAHTYDGNDGLFPVVPKEHIVFTRSAKEREPAEHITFSDQDPVEYIRAQSNKTILVAGGGLLNATLLKAGIVTDIVTCIHPIILGSGIRQFDGITFEHKTLLTKISEKDIGDNVVKIHYTIKH